MGVSKYKPQSGRKIPKGANIPLNDKLSRLKKRDYIIGDSDDLVHMDWSSEWSELKNLGPLPHGRGSERTIEQSWLKSRKPKKSGASN